MSEIAPRFSPTVAIVITLSAWLGVSAVAAAHNDAWLIGAGVEQFTWEEFDEDGSLLLEENGERFNVALTWLGRLPERWSGRYRINLYLGSVDYDGAYQDGTPLVTDTDYAGLLNEVTLRYDYSNGGLRWGGFGSLGLDIWERAIANPALDIDQIERYRILYGRAGIALGDELTAGWYGELGVKYPLFTWETVELEDLGFMSDAKLRPGRDFSLTAEVSYRFDDRWSVLAGYDGYRFRASETVAAQVDADSYIGILQPRSTMDVLYVRALYTLN